MTGAELLAEIDRVVRTVDTLAAGARELWHDAGVPPMRDDVVGALENAAAALQHAHARLRLRLSP